MAFDTKFKMSIQDASGNYYSATLQPDGTYSVTTSGSQYLKVLPDGWADTQIVWERDKSYLGIFRSKADISFKFSLDARAIIQYIRSIGGIQGYGLLTIYMIDFSSTAISYPIFYQSELNFKTYNDNMKTELLEIGTLDSGLVRDLRAFGDTKYNVKIWDNIGTTESPSWVTDAKFLLHDGIKLLYNATFVTSATEESPLIYFDGLDTSIVGFNNGAMGSGGHNLPSMAQYNIVQNNGTTTYIGNDILQPFLIQGNQHMGASIISGSACELDFWNTNSSRPYTTENSCLKNMLSVAPSFDMFVNLTAYFAKNLDGTYLTIETFNTTDPHDTAFLGFVLFEIGADNKPLIVSGRMQYITLYKLPLFGASTTPTGPVNVTVPVTIQYDKCYVFGLIYDSDVPSDARIISDFISQCYFTKLQISILSKYDSGVSGVPVPAPFFPPSVTACFRLHQLLEKVVPYFATRRTDGYGFPVPVATTYEGVSGFLSNPSLPAIQDVVPYQIMITSDYCLHNLSGQSYIPISLNQIFDFCKKVLGCGMGIEGNAIRIENLAYWFDSTNMILDLGYDVADLEIEQMADGMAANLKLGYSKADTNSDFGVIAYNTELYFNTPASNVAGVMDYQEAGILAEPTAIEKKRAQRVSQPIGNDINPANPSSDGGPIALYCLPSVTQILPDIGGNELYPNVIMYDPSDNPVSVSAYQLTQRNGVNLPAAQSTDPTASAAPYIASLYYPDSAYNVELSPCRALFRETGSLLHSVLDLMDSEYLTFRNTAVMQYNNTTLDLTSIESNLVSGGNVITEFKDVQIGSLPAQLYKPILLKVKSKYPVNMYQILNTNPRGYIRFFWKNRLGFGAKEYKGFLFSAKQSAANNAPTEFLMWATPDMAI